MQMDTQAVHWHYYKNCSFTTNHLWLGKFLYPISPRVICSHCPTLPSKCLLRFPKQTCSLLIKRVVLVERLLNYLGQCDVSTDRGRRVFQTAAGKFSQLTDGCAYDEGVRSTMTKMFIFSSHKFNIRNCILPNLPQAPLVGPSRPRESSWMKRLTLQAPKILEMVLSPSKSALERSLAEMEALDWSNFGLVYPSLLLRCLHILIQRSTR